MRQADIERGRTYMNWPETATRTVTSIRGVGMRRQTASEALSGSGHPIAPCKYDRKDRTHSDHQSTE